jgi:small-conductance mechanosensitive channel
VWVSAVLRVFELSGPLRAGVNTLLSTPWTLGNVTVSLGSIVLFIVMLVVAITLGRFIRFVLDEGVLPHVSLPRGVPAAISASAEYVVIGSGLVLAMSASGVAMDRFTVLAGALGVGIGFGLQNVVNNFISGLILIFERPVQIGDLIELGSAIGEVKHIGIRSSRIRTFEGAEVIVPNAQLISERVVNWTFTDQQRRLELPVGVAYGSNPQQVVELLIAVARANPDVLHYPPPVALLTGFGDSALNFSLRAWTTRQDNISVVRSQIAMAVHDALREAAIEIPFPQRDVRLVDTPGEAHRVHGGEAKAEAGTEAGSVEPDAAPSET